MRLCGIHPVLERLESNPRSIRKVYLLKRTSDSRIFHLCRETGVDFEVVNEERFTRLTVGLHAQGAMAEVDGFAYVTLDTILAAREEPRPTLMFLDGLQDPQNLGALLRSLACLGDCAVVIPKHHAAEVTDAVLRVASGGENYVSVARVANLVYAVEAAKKAGYWIAAAVVSGGESLMHARWRSPMGCIFGAEDQGIRPGLLKHADLRITLPMSGAELSYNVAVAVALIGYEVTRRRTVADAGASDGR